MIDLNNAVEFVFDVDKNSMKELAKLPAVRAGIIKDQKLWSWKKELRYIGGGITANKIVKKPWGRATVGISMASVFDNTSILKEFKKLLEKKVNILLNRLINEAPAGYKSAGVKRAANSFAALLKQAYMNMSKKRSNNERRILQKGFDGYAIGTGQTLQSIKAEPFEVKK